MKQNVLMKKEILKVISFILVLSTILVLMFFVRQKLLFKANEYLENDNFDFAKNVDEKNPLLKMFCGKFPKREVILACEDDINGDKKNDLVVISRLNDEIETIALVSDGENKYLTTKPILAPKENQLIKFINVDKSGPNEVLITGEKKGQVGYAIYRYDNGTLIDIFGEGMEDCC